LSPTPRFWLFWSLSAMPALAAAACTLYVCSRFAPSDVTDTLFPRYAALMTAIAAAASVPRLWVRLCCLVLMFGLVVLAGFSVGLFYVPALAAALAAVLVQAASHGAWHGSKPA